MKKLIIRRFKMSEDKKKEFDPNVEIVNIAEIRVDLATDVSRVETARLAMEATPEYKKLETSRVNMLEAESYLADVVRKFKYQCEMLFIEDGEKKFPGGQIKEVTSLMYKDVEAIDWAIEHGHKELLSLVKGKFKKVCGGITPPFVEKIKTGKMYIDSDLSQFMEGANANPKR